MRHLTPEEFVEAMDGVASSSVLEHAATCAVCREQLLDLNAMARAAEGVEVPEPSPLYWDHLSGRVRAAIESESIGLSSRGSLVDRLLAFGAAWRLLVPAAAVVVLAMVLVVPGANVIRRVGAPVPPSSSTPLAPRASVSDVRAGAASSRVAAQASDPADTLEDESLAFVADLASGLDWSVAAEIGLTPTGGIDAAVLDLDAAERAELQRLLSEAIGNGVTM